LEFSQRPDDNKFVDCYIASGAHYLITHDSHFSILKSVAFPKVNSDGLARMKEHDFLDVLESISLIGKNVKQELQQSLQLRNACGHPNSLKIGVNKVSSHIEILILNVFSKF